MLGVGWCVSCWAVVQVLNYISKDLGRQQQLPSKEGFLDMQNEVALKQRGLDNSQTTAERLSQGVIDSLRGAATRIPERKSKIAYFSDHGRAAVAGCGSRCHEEACMYVHACLCRGCVCTLTACAAIGALACCRRARLVKGGTSSGCVMTG